MGSFLAAAADLVPCAYRFVGFRLEVDGTLLRGETPVRLPTEELAALRLLLARAGEIVTPLELKRNLWGGMHVASDSVSRCVASLRARLQPEDCIQNVYKRGYRISANVQVAGLRPAGALPRLAILPFAAGRGVPEYFGMAVTEELMDLLSGARYAIASLVAQDSVFTLARRGLSAQEIGAALSADLVLTGQLFAIQGHDRLRAEMIRTEDGARLWIEDLLRERGRIGALSWELVNRLNSRLHSGGLSIAAAAAPAAEVESFPHRNEAHELFLRAHYEWQTLERHCMQDSMARLLRAIELDPSAMAARVDLAHLAVAQASHGFMSPVVQAGLVRRAAERIPSGSENDAGKAEALLPALGWVDFHFDHNLPTALRAFSRSAHLPHDPWTTRVRVLFALSRRRFGEAIDLLSAAIALDPYSPWLQALLAWALHLAADSAASVAQTRKALTLFPGHDGPSLYGAMILAYNGHIEQSLELANDLTARSRYFDLATAVHAYALASAGCGDEARELLERLQWLSRERFVINTFNAAVYVALGEPDAAIAELRASLENRCPWFFQMLADPRLKPLHGRPEFERMGRILPEMEAEVEEGAAG